MAINYKIVRLPKDITKVSNIEAVNEINKFNNIKFEKKVIDNDELFKEYLKSLDGVNLIGHINSPIGLGHNTRIILEALIELNVPYVIIDIRTMSSNEVDDYQSTVINPFSTNIVCINPDNLDFYSTRLVNYLKDKYNIAMWAWELEEVPTNWIEESIRFDKIWTISTFCRDIFKNKLLNKNIDYINLPINVSKLDKNSCKKHLNIDDDKFVFLFTFDYNSDPYRKNVKDLIKAFNIAFENNTDVLLLLKTHSLPSGVIEESHNIRIINDKVSYDERTIIMNCSDAYVSIHRTEGYGLTILESIMLEKPTIATNYSGSLDFCDEDYMELVNGPLKKVEEDSFYNILFKYDNDIYWCNPDINETAEKMLKVYNNYSEYEDKIKIWKSIVEKHINMETLKNFIKKSR